MTVRHLRIDSINNDSSLPCDPPPPLVLLLGQNDSDAASVRVGEECLSSVYLVASMSFQI